MGAAKKALAFRHQSLGSEGPVRLREKVAVITGGTKGIGRAIAERYLAEGASVVCASRAGNNVKQLTDKFPDRAAYHPVDVTSIGSVDELMDFATEAFGRMDILVCCAGVNHDGRINRLLPEQWEHILSTNLTGPYLCTRSAVDHLKRSPSGRIINVSSVLGTRPTIGAGGYCASKAGLEMLTKVSAMELGRYGILVNCVAPGFINAGMGKAVEANGKIWPAYRRRIALDRSGHANEIADAAVFLAGPESTYITGHVLEVGGGLAWA